MHQRLILLIVCLSLNSWAQFDLRSDELEALRTQKAQALAPETRGAGEEKFRGYTHKPWARSLFRSASGFGPGIGGMVPGAGFSGGVNWSRADLLDAQLVVSARARVSIRSYYLGELNVALPHLFDDHAFLLFHTIHTDYAQMPYFGSGAKTERWQRTSFRLEETSVELRPGIRPIRDFTVGAIGAFRAFNIGSGASSRFPSSETRFTPVTSPGIDNQGNFWQTGAFAMYDLRKGGTQPISGGRYLAEFSRMNDRSFNGRFSHNRVDFDGSHYLPMFHHTRTIALHGHTTLTDARADHATPFYLQPSVGGAETLRGFRPFRFRDRNAMWFNAEYRWETSPGLDMAIFADGGKVFRDWSQLNMHDLETSYGLGFRFKARRNLVLRFDVGASREGVGIWLRFQNIF